MFVTVVIFLSTEERRASDCRTKADNIKRAAVCSLYLQQREKSLNSTSSVSYVQGAKI